MIMSRSDRLILLSEPFGRPRRAMVLVLSIARAAGWWPSSLGAARLGGDRAAGSAARAIRLFLRCLVLRFGGLFSRLLRLLGRLFLGLGDVLGVLGFLL